MVLHEKAAVCLTAPPHREQHFLGRVILPLYATEVFCACLPCCHAEQSKDRYSQLRFNQTNTYGIYISVRRILSCFRRVLSEADCPPCEGAELRDPLTHSALSATALMLEAPAVLLMVALIPAVQVPTQQKGQCCLSSSMKTEPLQKSLGALGATE